MNKEDLGNTCNKYSEGIFFLIALKRKHTKMLIEKWINGMSSQFTTKQEVQTGSV